METKAGRVLLAAAALVGCMAPVHAAVVSEVEPNDALATAQSIVSSDALITINGQRTFSDPSDDFFRFQVAPNTLISISATLTSSGLIANAESAMGLFGPTDDLVASAFESTNVAGGPLGSISFLATTGGFYSLGFSGFDPGLISCGGSVTQCYDTDDDFVADRFAAGGGTGGSTGWSYSIGVVVGTTAKIPEPASCALLLAGLGMVAAVGHRRRESP